MQVLNRTLLNLTGKTTLRELAATIASCNLFIGMDTSGLHMAIALNVPSIGIAGGAHFGRFIPWGVSPRHLILTHKMECFCCNWHCNKAGIECIQNVLPEQVVVEAKKLLL